MKDSARISQYYFSQKVKSRPAIHVSLDGFESIDLPFHLPVANCGCNSLVYCSQYSWLIDGSRAVSFHTVVELYVMIQLAEKGVKTAEVLKAHKRLGDFYNTHFPFAQKRLLQEIKTDGKLIYWKNGDDVISLNGSDQFNLEIISVFFKKLDFGEEDVVSKLWPMGKEHAIVIDPGRKFGHPIIDGKNIYPETIFEHFQAGDPVPYIAHIYQITEKEAEDAIAFCKPAA